MCNTKDKPSVVLIVCGQGTYRDGQYYAEHRDHNVYLKHAVTVKGIVKMYNYTHVVCSGGPTKEETGALTEAESFMKIWKDTNSGPLDEENIFLDKLSLDSAENVYLGLMEARKNLGDVPIRRIGLYAAWKFKKPRFNSLAKELGIIRRFYFHGLATTDEAEVRERARQGEDRLMKKIVAANDHLLLSADLRKKHEKRWYAKETPYEERLNCRRNQFPEFFEVLDEIQEHGIQYVESKRLKDVFKKEVVEPSSP